MFINNASVMNKTICDVVIILNRVNRFPWRFALKIQIKKKFEKKHACIFNFEYAPQKELKYTKLKIICFTLFINLFKRNPKQNKKRSKR